MYGRCGGEAGGAGACHRHGDETKGAETCHRHGDKAGGAEACGKHGDEAGGAGACHRPCAAASTVTGAVTDGYGGMCSSRYGVECCGICGGEYSDESGGGYGGMCSGVCSG